MFLQPLQVSATVRMSANQPMKGAYLMSKTPDMNAQIREIHAVYCAATGMQLRIGIGEYTREASWFRFLQAGFTTDDLYTVVRYLKRKIHEGTRNIGALKFSNLIERLEAFEEDLGLAKAEQRNAKPQPTAKDRVLQQARPTIVPMTPEQGANTAKPVAHFIAALRKAAQ